MVKTCKCITPDYDYDEIKPDQARLIKIENEVLVSEPVDVFEFDRQFDRRPFFGWGVTWGGGAEIIWRLLYCRVGPRMGDGSCGSGGAGWLLFWGRSGVVTGSSAALSQAPELRGQAWRTFTGPVTGGSRHLLPLGRRRSEASSGLSMFRFDAVIVATLPILVKVGHDHHHLKCWGFLEGEGRKSTYCNIT